MVSVNTILQDRYRIDDVIGRGGMGAVYLAHDLRLGCNVAIKETLFNDEDLRRQFLREARLLAKLRHPALPRVTDHFVELDSQFFLMEFIPGDDLASQLKTRKRPFEFDLVYKWSLQLLDALEYLHAHTPPVIHRDIKPQNLKVNEQGQIILLDFGLAKGAPQLVEQASASSTVFGYTLNYAPLEQIQGKGADPRSDLFSLGATIYHLLTGVTPPGAMTRAAELIVKNPDPLLPANDLNPRVPIAVAEVIRRAMALNPNDRPVNAAQLRVELHEAAGGLKGDATLLPATVHQGQVQRAGDLAGRPAVKPKPSPPHHEDASDGLRTHAEPAPRRTVIKVPQAADIKRTRKADVERAQKTRPHKKGNKQSAGDFRALLIVLLFAGTGWFALNGSFNSNQGSPPPSVTATTEASRPPTPPSPPRSLPIVKKLDEVLEEDSPIILSPSDGVVGEEQKQINLQWSTVSNAVKYRIEINDKNFSKAESLGTTSETHFLIPASTDLRFVRVAAIMPGGKAKYGLWKAIGTLTSVREVYPTSR